MCNSGTLGPLKPAMLAATEAGRRWVLGSSDPILLQETNNTVVWLFPHAVVAKVATRADGTDKLIREHQVATAIADLGAPIGRPFARILAVCAPGYRLHSDTVGTTRTQPAGQILRR